MCEAELCYGHSSKLVLFFIRGKRANAFDCSCCQQPVHAFICSQSGITFWPPYCKIPPSLSTTTRIIRAREQPGCCRGSGISQGLPTGTPCLQDIGGVATGDTNPSCLNFSRDNPGISKDNSSFLAQQPEKSLLKGFNSLFFIKLGMVSVFSWLFLRCCHSNWVLWGKS